MALRPDSLFKKVMRASKEAVALTLLFSRKAPKNYSIPVCSGTNSYHSKFCEIAVCCKVSIFSMDKTAWVIGQDAITQAEDSQSIIHIMGHYGLVSPTLLNLEKCAIHCTAEMPSF